MTLHARWPDAGCESFEIAAVPMRGAWEHRIARFFGAKVPSTGDDAFDRRFELRGNPPRGLSKKAARRALVMFHRETAGKVNVAGEGLSVTFEGIPGTEDLESFLDAAETIVDSIKS